VPHRQVVLTIPKRLRAYCLYRRRLLGDIARVAARTVTAAIRTPGRRAPHRRGPPRAGARHAPYARSPTRRRSPECHLSVT